MPYPSLPKVVSMAGIAGVLAGCAGMPSGSSGDNARLQRIQNIVVIYAENHSFDNLYGLFPGANGISRATPEQMTQLDHDGTPLKELLVFARNGQPDPAFPPRGGFENVKGYIAAKDAEADLPERQRALRWLPVILNKVQSR